MLPVRIGMPRASRQLAARTPRESRRNAASFPASLSQVDKLLHNNIYLRSFIIAFKKEYYFRYIMSKTLYVEPSNTDGLLYPAINQFFYFLHGRRQTPDYRHYSSESTLSSFYKHLW